MTNENNLNLTEIIREIHDGVAKEMYCKGVDDFVKKICEKYTEEESNGNYRFYAVEIKQSIHIYTVGLSCSHISAIQ